jgi:uncharacterized oxidoreductase
MFLLDMATSTIAMGKARVAHLSGKTAPEGALINAAGEPTNDPAVMFDEPIGALTTFGQHKGFGLALLGDMLGGSFSGGGAYSPEHEAPARIFNNMMAILIDPDVFGLVDEFNEDLDKYTDWVKASPAAPGSPGVLFPGDPERRSAQDRLANGIYVDGGTVAQLVETAKSVGVPHEALRGIVDDR